MRNLTEIAPAAGEKRRRRLTLLFCFLVPALLMTLLYTLIGVRPGSDNSVLI